MSNYSRKEYLLAIRSRYLIASRAEKSAMLDEFCSVCGYHRKYAIRLLNARPEKKRKRQSKKRGRNKRYDHTLILEVLKKIWVAANLPCAKRLKAMIPLWLPHFDDFIVPDDVKEKLLTISAATIDRLMAPGRKKYKKRGLATTKPGAILKKRIPVKTKQWDETRPGFIEADTVAHCGDSTAGMFAYTLNSVDIATGWTEQRATWGKGEQGTVKAIESIEKSLPFPLLGFDCDNGSEFLNWHLVRYLDNDQRKRPVQFTRARAYHKNDNAHIENKNWTHVRQYIGYQRFDHPDIVEWLNQLYTTEWRLFLNYFIPSVKLVEKVREGAKVIKKHDQPKTPVERLLESDDIPEQTKQALRTQWKALNPFELQRQISNKIKRLLRYVDALKSTTEK